MKLYFDNEGITCRPLVGWKEIMQLRGVDEMELFEAAKDDSVMGYYYCTYHGGIGEKEDMNCGKFCKEYTPRNGKSGRCKYHSTTFYKKIEKKLILKF